MLKSLSVNRNNLVPFRLTKQSCIGYSANFKGKETWLFLSMMMPKMHLELKIELLLSLPVLLLQEGGPLPGPETGLLSNTRKWIVRGDTCADKARDFIGKGHPGGEQEGKGTQENCSAECLAVLGFMVMGLVSGWSLANHSNSESFLVAHALLSQDGC